jgi:hypothetical protein
LSQKKPDRYELDYAISLSNHAAHLADAGQNEEALVQVREALEIRQRLAPKNPVRIAEGLLINLCVRDFLAWLCDQDKAAVQSNLDQTMALIPSHRRAPTRLYLAFVEACGATDQVTRSGSFRRVLSNWHDLSTEQKAEREADWLCAAAWIARFEPRDFVEPRWEANWRQYSKRRNGRVPQWMLEVARRLGFQWPE